MAQEHSIYCKNVDSTAASQECLKKHLKTAQNRLNKIYVKLGETLEADRLEELKSLQKIWLTYRDAECMWEAARPEEVSLKRVNELSCMARVTEDRADLLTIAYDDSAHPDKQRQFGDFPSWMNAVAKQYPAIYWNYGARIEGDMNCDGQNEHVMTGLQMGTEYPDIHLAIIENPLVGKPTPTLFTFPVVTQSDKEIENSICNDDVSVEIQDVGFTEEADKTCNKLLVLTPKGCKSKKIYWTGKMFDIEVDKDPIHKKEVEKN